VGRHCVRCRVNNGVQCCILALLVRMVFVGCEENVLRDPRAACDVGLNARDVTRGSDMMLRSRHEPRLKMCHLV
jgi:hypothetical protein